MLSYDISQYEKRSEFFKALGHPTRLWIVDQLSDGKSHCVCEFVQANSVDFSTISQHLRVLKNAKIIASEKRGKEVYYQLNCCCINTFLTCIDEKVLIQ